MRGRPARPRCRNLAAYFAGASFTLYLTHYTIQEHLAAAMNAYQWSKAWVLVAALTLPVPVALLIASQTERKYRQIADWMMGLRLRARTQASRQVGRANT